MEISSANLIAAVLLTAFVIERIVAVGSFFVSYRRVRLDKDGLAKVKPSRRNSLRVLEDTFWRTAVAGAIAAAVLYQFEWMRLLHTFRVVGHSTGDAVLTWLVLVCGTERLSSFIGAGADEAVGPVARQAALKIDGTLAADDAAARAVSDRTGR
jgi:hypothetical protein